MKHYDGLTFARQGLQVSTLVIVPLVLVSVLVGGLLLFPQLANSAEWLIIITIMLFLFGIAFLSIKAYFKWAVVPCTVDVGNNQITINLTKSTVFYPYRQKTIPMANIRNAACSMDVRLGKSFINIKTYKPKATYMLQYWDEKANDPNPELWTNIEALVAVYNQNQGTEQITDVGFFEGGVTKVLLYICGAFLMLFIAAMLIDSEYRTVDRYIKLGYFAFIFAGLFFSNQYAKWRRNKKR